jgi:hypothetical protein
VCDGDGDDSVVHVVSGVRSGDAVVPKNERVAYIHYICRVTNVQLWGAMYTTFKKACKTTRSHDVEGKDLSRIDLRLLRLSL